VLAWLGRWVESPPYLAVALHLPGRGLRNDVANVPVAVRTRTFDATRTNAPFRILKSVTATFPRPDRMTRPRMETLVLAFVTDTVVLLAVFLSTGAAAGGGGGGGSTGGGGSGAGGGGGATGGAAAEAEAVTAEAVTAEPGGGGGGGGGGGEAVNGTAKVCGIVKPPIA